MDPLVSVVIPTHDRPLMLERAVDSVLRQTYRNVQLIVVDDASTAALPAIEGTVVRHARRMGPGAARNTGLAHCSGEFIIFLDDDDWLDENRIKSGVQTIGSARSQACATVEVFDDGQQRRIPDEFRGDLGAGILSRVHPAMGQVLFRREDVVQFDPTLRVAEDREWWFRMVHAAVFAWCDDVGLFLHRHSGTRVATDVDTAFRARRVVALRHAEASVPEVRARLYAHTSSAAILANRRVAGAWYAVRSLIERPTMMGLKLIAKALVR